MKLKQLGSLEVEKRVALPLFERRFDGPDLQPADHERLGLQMQKVRDLMLDGKWRTLEQIGQATGAPPQSVSARLRDLRKPRWGAFQVDRRRTAFPGIFEYRVREGQA